ncbi:Transcriptional regulator ATRX-like [Gracilariopsis chorda]|uniref:Transcriptional regulator ATRX-like n=1 Tax=Gracilariopsis chorda TaxID=448386 RepID=A0A2V3IMP9_9FLOR|nr:Transcriptional regulator ATRX-like [Gracilariopsis chorda]|eukprot:PXF42390.1 Transcriptional regulator ATRX-like [Gracilariopsis chorda]
MGIFQPSRRRKNDRPLLQSARPRLTPRTVPSAAQPATLSSSGSGSSQPSHAVPERLAKQFSSTPSKPVQASPPPRHSRAIPNSEPRPASTPKFIPIRSGIPVPKPTGHAVEAQQAHPSHPHSRDASRPELSPPVFLRNYIPSPDIKGLHEALQLLVFLQENGRETCLQAIINDFWHNYNANYSKKRRQLNERTCTEKRVEARSSTGNAVRGELRDVTCESTREQSSTPVPPTPKPSSNRSKTPIDIICIDDDDEPIPDHKSKPATHEAPTKQSQRQTPSQTPEQPVSLATKRPRVTALPSQENPIEEDPSVLRQRRAMPHSAFFDRYKAVSEAVERRFFYFQSKAGRPEQDFCESDRMYNIWKPVDSAKPVVQLHEQLCSSCLRREDSLMAPLHLEAIRFLWYHVVENPCSGAVLVHGIGYPRAHLLLAFAHMLVGKNVESNCAKFLIVCPQECLREWVYAKECFQEFICIEILEEDSCFETMATWHRTGGLVICSYELYMFLTENHDISRRERAIEALCIPGPDIIVLDEATRLCVPRNLLFTNLRRTRTTARLALTSTPLLASLARTWQIVDWACPDLLGNRSGFWDLYVKPMTRGVVSLTNTLENQAAVNMSSYLCRKLNMISFEVNHKMREETLNDCGRFSQESVIYVNMHRNQRRTYRDLVTCLANGIRSGACSSIFAVHVLSIFTCSVSALHASLERELAMEQQGEHFELQECFGRRPFDFQIAAEIKQIIGRPTELASAKFETLRYFVSTCINDNERAVVFVSSESLQNEVAKDLKEHLPIGGDSIFKMAIRNASESEVEELDSFNQSDKGAALIAVFGSHIDLMEGAGWGFVNANRVIIMNAVWHHAAFVQAINRVHNFAQRSSIIYVHHIVAADSVETGLSQTRSTVESVVGSNVDETDDRKSLAKCVVLGPKIHLRLFDEIRTDMNPSMKQATIEVSENGGLLDTWRDHYNILQPLIGVETTNKSFLVRSVKVHTDMYLSVSMGLDAQSHSMKDKSAVSKMDASAKHRITDLFFERQETLSELVDIMDFGLSLDEREAPQHRFRAMSLIGHDGFFREEPNPSFDIRCTWVEYCRLYESEGPRVKCLTQNGSWNRKRMREDDREELSSLNMQRRKVSNG